MREAKTNGAMKKPSSEDAGFHFLPSILSAWKSEAFFRNSTHFSVFNPDAIKDLKLYKGGLPSRYGGRVSSVLDIYQKEGNSKEFHANGGIGLVASRLLAEGPLKKDKGSFLFGGRSSYAHLFLPLFDIDNVAYFYDLNTKLSYKLNDKNNIYLSSSFL